MSVNWYFYSDTNAPADEIETVLRGRKQTLTSFQRIEDLFIKLENTPHAVLFLKAHTMYNVYELCQEISSKYPHVYIIILSPDNMENVKKAMLVGASNILRFSSKTEEITEVIIQAHKYMHHRLNQEETPIFHLPKINSKVISVCSTKGGMGRTLLTVNLAVALAKSEKKVAIIDANIQFGDVAMFFDIKPKQTIYEWVKEGFERGQYSIEKYMCKHECGISLLAPPPRPEFFEIITEEHIEMAINELKKIYDVIVIDTSSYLSDVHLKGLVHSDEILLLTTSELPILRNTKLYMDTLQTLNQSEKVKVILNRDSRRKSIETKRMVEILQKPIHTFLPDQSHVAISSINEGIPFILKNSRNPLSKGILQLAQQLLMHGSKRVEVSKSPKQRLLLSR